MYIGIESLPCVQRVSEDASLSPFSAAWVYLVSVSVAFVTYLTQASPLETWFGEN